MGDGDDFRIVTRRWLEENCPPSMRTPPAEVDDGVWGGTKSPPIDPDARTWLDRMAGRGFTAPTWPREHGGAGLTGEEAGILREEMRRLGCRAPLKSLGLWMLGPALLEYGTEAQKREHLPRIARGEARWCQGYSEPEAGSDLAGLRTRAVLDGDTYVVDGRKVWTSHAHLADWMFCLVRTDPGAPKHRGITFLLVDMRTPGITVRPILLISGSSPFCETLFEGVRVPATHVVGKPNEGWEVAKSVLQHERALISEMRDARSGENATLDELAREYGALDDPAVRDAIARVDIDFLAYRLTMQRAREAARASGTSWAPAPETSMLKLFGTEVSKRRHELMVSIMGFRGLGWSGEGFLPAEIDRTRQWLRSRASSIEGGTSEIQLNIIAKRVLGLPD
jgi:alkylation response protein AidB-like acyl-CoA dehydrogenase